MITHTSDSHQIPSQNKTKSKLQILKKNAKNPNFGILQPTLHATHLLKLLEEMYKYETDPTRTVGATERTRDAGRTDGRTEWNQYAVGYDKCRAMDAFAWSSATMVLLILGKRAIVFNSSPPIRRQAII